VQFVHESLGTAALVEEFIDGRELYVGVIGNDRLRAFPVWEMSFAQMPERTWHLATERVKWSTKYQQKHGIMTDAAILPEGVAAEIQHTAKRVYRALDLNGYARIDFRMDQDGRFYVIEANPNPQLAWGEDFAESAERAGVMYPALLERIVMLGIAWQPERVR
jgi:D-alanine-D-alanine ligase